MKYILFFSLLSFLSSVSQAQLVDGHTLDEVSLQQLKGRIAPGTVLVLGEVHDSPEHHQNQVDTLQILKDFQVSVGMEFFEWPHQNWVDQFTAGQMTEHEFLVKVGWGKTPFEFYRRQVLFSAEHGGRTLALNAPRALTAKIAKFGLGGLSEKEKLLLPQDFSLGSALYFDRFKFVMGEHVPAQSVQKYFEAQSTWDDTMAEVATAYIRENPNQVLVILVGDFHTAYGGGLPDRLRARGAQRVVTVSQVKVGGLSEEEKQMEIAPHPKWGPRGDFVWINP